MSIDRFSRRSLSPVLTHKVSLIEYVITYLAPWICKCRTENRTSTKTCWESTVAPQTTGPPRTFQGTTFFLEFPASPHVSIRLHKNRRWRLMKTTWQSRTTDRADKSWYTNAIVQSSNATGNIVAAFCTRMSSASSDCAALNAWSSKTSFWLRKRWSMPRVDAFVKTSNASKCTAAVTGKDASATRAYASVKIAKIWLTDWSRRKRENWSSNSGGISLLINDRISRWDGKATHRQWTQLTTRLWIVHARSLIAWRNTVLATFTTSPAVRPVDVRTVTTSLTSMTKKKKPDGKPGTQGTTMIARLYRRMTSTRSTSFCSRHRKNTKPNNCISIWSSSPWIFSLMTLEISICRLDLEIPLTHFNHHAYWIYLFFDRNTLDYFYLSNDPWTIYLANHLIVF